VQVPACLVLPILGTVFVAFLIIGMGMPVLLMSRVWPNVTIEEDNLRVHMAGLRKALGDGRDGARFIVTLAGRGYCFVAPVSRTNSPRCDAASVVAANFPTPIYQAA
jgi:DNA-binding winged helix-turn-helix (wHTH) protein